MTEKEKREKMDEYYDNGAAKLHKMVNKQVDKFKDQISQKDLAEFYSVANETFHHALENYDGRQSFDKYIYHQVWGKVCTHMTMLNREKRTIDRRALSLDAPIEPGGSTTFGEVIPSKESLEESLLEEKSENVEAFMAEISERQREICELIMEGYSPADVQEKLGLSSTEYNKEMSDMRSYEKSKYLIRNCYPEREEKEEIMERVEVTTAEKTKDTSFSVSAICKKLKNHYLRDNHVLQRSSDQWGSLAKSELISDILQGKSLTPIIISEEIKGGVVMHWLIDGKQRCTITDSFLNNGFAISKTVQRYLIPYQTIKKDEDGNDVMNEEGFPIMETKYCDIRNKKFSKLPEELQDKFLDYQIPVMLNLNCTKEEIAYDIARFNRCRAMTKVQSGWTGMDEGFASLIDSVLKMPFFDKDCEKSNYKNGDNRRGSMRAMAVETIMATDFLDHYNREVFNNCKYISENANDSNIIGFQLRIERLAQELDSETSELFTSSGSYIWFTLFARFEKFGRPVAEYVKFLKAFKNGLKNEKLFDGESYMELAKEKKNKTKWEIAAKLDYLERMMKHFLHIEEKEIHVNPEFVEKFSNTDLAKSLNVSKEQIPDIAEKTFSIVKEEGSESDEDAEETTLLLADSLNEWMLNIPENESRKILTPGNAPYLIGLVKYAYDKEYGDDECMGWLKKIAAQGAQKITDFPGMKHNLDLAMTV